MTIQDQYEVAEVTCQFLDEYGLVKQNVAHRCGIPRAAFYSWLSHKYAITEKQLKTVQDFMSDYRQRMS